MDGYYSLTGFRLRLWMRLTFIIGLLLPKGFKFETKLIEPDGWAHVYPNRRSDSAG